MQQHKHLKQVGLVRPTRYEFATIESQFDADMVNELLKRRSGPPVTAVSVDGKQGQVYLCGSSLSWEACNKVIDELDTAMGVHLDRLKRRDEIASARQDQQFAHLMSAP